MTAAAEAGAGWQRLDHFLWCARFLRSRPDCARLIATGLVRINRQPTEKAHARVRVGDVITLPLHASVRVIEVLALAPRRGPAAQAQLLYRERAEDAARYREVAGCFALTEGRGIRYD